MLTEDEIDVLKWLVHLLKAEPENYEPYSAMQWRLLNTLKTRERSMSYEALSLVLRRDGRVISVKSVREFVARARKEHEYLRENIGVIKGFGAVWIGPRDGETLCPSCGRPYSRKT